MGCSSFSDSIAKENDSSTTMKSQHYETLLRWLKWLQDFQIF